LLTTPTTALFDLSFLLVDLFVAGMYVLFENWSVSKPRHLIVDEYFMHDWSFNFFHGKQL
jgi:hypothetical protein